MGTGKNGASFGLCAKQGNSSKVLMDYCDAYTSPEGSLLLALSDGMGGYGGGEVASAIAVQTTIEVFQRSGFTNVRQALAEAIQLANQRIVDKQRTEPGLAQMGATIVLAVASNGDLTVAHVGDSRAVLFRGEYLLRLTTDHLVIVEREGALDNGAKSNPLFKGKSNVLSRYLGGPPPIPDFFEMKLETGDVIFLASDGITEYLLESRISRIVRDEAPEVAAVNIVDEAIRNRSHDHCSAAIGKI
jgi:protein phosphatase